MSADRCTALENLPNEIKDIILKPCDLKTFINLALTGPVFYEYVKEDENRIATKFVNKSIITKLRPLAIVRCLAQRMCQGRILHRSEAKEAMDTAKVNSFVDGVLVPQLEKFDPTRVALSITMAVQIISLRNDIDYYALELSKPTRRRGPRPVLRYHEPPSYHVFRTYRETVRFSRALYILQLSCDLFPRDVSRPQLYEEPSRLGGACAKFWGVFAPWEQLQVKCVQEMMHAHMQEMMHAHIANSKFTDPT